MILTLRGQIPGRVVFHADRDSQFTAAPLQGQQAVADEKKTMLTLDA